MDAATGIPKSVFNQDCSTGQKTIGSKIKNGKKILALLYKCIMCMKVIPANLHIKFPRRSLTQTFRKKGRVLSVSCNSLLVRIILHKEIKGTNDRNDLKIHEKEFGDVLWRSP